MTTFRKKVFEDDPQIIQNYLKREDLLSSESDKRIRPFTPTHHIQLPKRVLETETDCYRLLRHSPLEIGNQSILMDATEKKTRNWKGKWNRLEIDPQIQ